MHDIIFKLDPSQSQNYTLDRVTACGATIRAKAQGALNFKNGLTDLKALLNFRLSLSSCGPIKVGPRGNLLPPAPSRRRPDTDI